MEEIGAKGRSWPSIPTFRGKTWPISWRDYDLGELLSYKGIAEGVENSNFLVHTTRGYFILTLYEKRVAPEDIPFFLALMGHLAAAASPARSRSRTGPATCSAGSPAGRRRW